MIAQLGKVRDLLDRGFAPILALLTAVVLVTSLFEALGVAVIFVVFQVILDPDRLAKAGWIGAVISPFSAGDRTLFIVLTCVALFLVFALKAAVSLFTFWLKWHVQWRLHIRLATTLLAGYIASPLSFHMKNNSATLLRNIVANVSQTTQSCVLGLVDVISNALLLIGIFVVLMLVQPLISLLALAAIGGAAALFWRIGHSYFSEWGARSNAVAGEMYRAATEPLNGIKTIKVLGRESFFVETFHRRVSEYAHVNRDHYLVLQIPRQVLEVLVIAGLLGTIGVTAVQNRSPSDVIPLLALFAAAAYRLMPAAISIINALQNFRFAGAGLDSVYHDVMRFRADERARGAETRRPQALRFHDRIALSDITFTYEGVEQPALSGISLTIRQGEAIALVGSSGAGKTTLADLILGLHKPNGGVLSVDGVAYPDPAQLPRGLFGYVPQETFLTDDTIRRNVALGVADTAIDDARVDAALRMASLSDFVASLPHGLDTTVGERGVRLSGGQRQRLGIARALYGDPQVLILDEATSSLDSVTEAEITDAIDRLHGATTLLIIAHRLSTVRTCDRIFYLENGRVADAGTFAELNERNRGFRAMVKEMGLAVAAPDERTAAG